MPKETETRMLPVLLTPRELQDRGRALSAAYKQYESIEAEKKAANADFKESLDSARDEMNRLSEIIKSEHESRAIECRWVDDWEHNVRRCVRQDSGEVVDEQTIPADERQGSLLS